MFETLLQNLLTSLPVFALHFGATLVILVVGVILYTWVTPIDEAALIRAGNRAAALSFGAAVLGLAVPLAYCLATSVNLPDIVLWGAVAVVVQLATFFVINLVFRDLARRIEAGDVAAAITLAATKLAVAALNAAAITG